MISEVSSSTEIICAERQLPLSDCVQHLTVIIDSVFRPQWRRRLHLSLRHSFLMCYPASVLRSGFLWEIHLSYMVAWTVWDRDLSWMSSLRLLSPHSSHYHEDAWRRLHLLTHALVQSKHFLFQGKIYRILMQRRWKIHAGGKHLR